METLKSAINHCRAFEKKAILQHSAKNLVAPKPPTISICKSMCKLHLSRSFRVPLENVVPGWVSLVLGTNI